MRVSRSRLAGRSVTGAPLVALLAALLIPAAARAQQVAIVTVPQGTNQPYLKLVDPLSAAASPDHLMTRFMIGVATASPDGKTVAYVGSTGAEYLLRRQDTSGGAPQGGFANCFQPAWAPGGAELACWQIDGTGAARTRTLVAVAPDGSLRRPIYGPGSAPTGGETPPSWAPDGSALVFAEQRALFTVAATGGTPATAVPAAAGATIHSGSFSPDGASLAFIRLTDLGGGEFRSQLVVRNRATGAESVIADHAPPSHLWATGSPPQWSADGKRIAVTEAVYGSSTASTWAVVLLDSATGSNRKVLHAQNGGQVNSVSWARGTAPSYYVKHVEVAQAISPDLPALQGQDPLAAAAIPFDGTRPSAFGFGIPLVADKRSIVRVYVGDATLPAGASAQRTLRFRVSTPTGTREETAPAVVTAPDVAPSQLDDHGPLTAFLPAASLGGGGPRTLSVEINFGQQETECAGCYPNGNRAEVHKVDPAESARIGVAPVPIIEIGAGGSRTGDLTKLRAAFAGAEDVLPIADGGIVVGPSPGALVVQSADLTPLEGCVVLLTKLNVLRALSGAVAPLPGAGVTRWIGYGPPILGAPDTMCNGRAVGADIVLRDLDAGLFAHELGHTLGLRHAVGRSGPVPLNPTPLPYQGIGGVGYEWSTGTIFDKASTGDLMSYEPKRWTSPRTWQAMLARILAEVGRAAPARAAASAGPADPTAGAAARSTRRLIAGVLYGKRAEIVDAVTAPVTTPASAGPVAARVVARGARGKRVAAAAIRGALESEAGEGQPSLPFVVTLPARAKIASLQIRRASGKGRPLATLRRSRHAPRGRLLGLPKRAVASKPITVRWRAADRDRRTELSVVVLARRGSGAWRTIAMGPRSGSVSLVPASLSGRNPRLAVRMLVGDGLRTTTVKGRRIRLR